MKSPSEAKADEAGILSQVWCGGSSRGLGGESCCVAEVFECGLVFAGGCAQGW
jgi:hypothetical protein